MSFLFLSKLLPIFIYPLGLVFLLLCFSLILWWKYPRWLPFPLILALLIICLSGNAWMSSNLVKSLEWQYTPTIADIPNADVIVVLGGGIKAHRPPRPMVDVAEQGDRVIYGAKLYKIGKAPLLILSGGRIPWQNGENSSSEADDMEQLLLLFDVPTSAIIKEEESYNTHDNAVNTKKILQQQSLDRVILVTSALHMPRAVKVFRQQGIEVIPAPTDFLVTEQSTEIEDNWQKTILQLFPHSGHINRTTLAIKEYIGLIVYQLKGWI